MLGLLFHAVLRCGHAWCRQGPCCQSRVWL